MSSASPVADPAVRFAFTDEQRAFRDTVHDLLTRECAPSVVRDAWTNHTGRAPAVWAHLADMGVLGLLAPPDAGGLGLTFLDLVLVLEATGYAALPEPIVEHAAVAVPLLPDPAAAAAGRVTVAAATSDRLTVWADTADLVVLVEDEHVRVAARDDVELTPHRSVDRARRVFTIGSLPDAATSVTDPGAFDRGALGGAAQLVGLGARMLDLTVDYVRERRQFGVPVGSFQAVKHHLADVRIALEFARPLVYRAAWSVAHHDPDSSLHVSMAKAQAGDAAHRAGRAALQCHGAIGYSYEYDLHLFLKRAWAVAGAWGDARWHRARVGRAIL